MCSANLYAPDPAAGLAGRLNQLLSAQPVASKQVRAPLQLMLQEA